MSDKEKGGHESFSLEDIIAEVKAERDGKAIEGPDAGGKKDDAREEEKAMTREKEDMDGKNTGEEGAAHLAEAPGKHEEGKRQEAGRVTFFRPAVKEKKHADGEEIEPEASISGEDNAPGRRVILFKKKRPEDDEEREDGFAPYPVKDDEEFYIEEEEEEEEPPEPLLYDFLNVPFDDPTKAVKKLGRKLVGMSLRLLITGFLWLVCMAIAFRESLPVPALKTEAAGALLPALSAGFAALGTVLCWEPLTAGVWRLLKLRPTCDSMTAFACIVLDVYSACTAFGLCSGEPMSDICLSICFFALLGKRKKAVSLRRTYKCMEISAVPTAVKSVGGKKFGGAVKTDQNAWAEPLDVCERDFSEKCGMALAPASIIAAVVLAAVAAFGPGKGEGFLQSLAAISCCLGSWSLCLAGAWPWEKGTKRLFASGAALINHRTALRLSWVKRVVLSDSDIFPLGSVHIAGMKITSQAVTMEQALADAAAVMRDIGGGIAKAFGDLAREQYLVPRKASDVKYYDGGIQATVHGDRVLIGSAAFLSGMGVLIHEGSDKKNAVFLAVNSRLAAIFTLKYTVQPQPYAAFGVLGRCGVIADLAVKDFTISERMVENRFAVKKTLINIPEINMREAYWQEEIGREEPVCAILTRDSILAFAETIGTAKGLVSSVRLNTFCGCACTVLGMITMYFLAASGKLYLASVGNMMLYMLVWCLPVWFTSAFMTNR